MPLPEQKTVADQLFQSAEARTHQLGVVFDPNVSSSMRSLADRGGATVLDAAKKKPPDHQEQYVDAATRVGSNVMVVFVDEMAIERLKSPDHIAKHGKKLTNDLYTKIRDLLCPLWPIC